MEVGYAPRMKQVIMDRCGFLCMRSPLFNSGGYEDPTHSNLAVTTILSTRIHDITYQK